MSYQKHSLIDGETLIDAELLGEMDEGIAGAYFKTDKTLSLADGVLSVNTATKTDRTLPITAAEVDLTIGNIGALLDTL